MQDCIHFIAQKIYLWPETGIGGLMDPRGVEDVKRTDGG